MDRSLQGQDKKSMKTYLFDLDGTLADTSSFRVLRANDEGRGLIVNNPDKISINCNQNFLNFVNYLSNHARVKVITNRTQRYAKTILEKCGFSENIQVLFNLGKPRSNKLKSFIGRYCNSENSLVIGDSAEDIIAAHGCKIPSIGLFHNFGYSTLGQLTKAEPARIALSYRKLEEMINEFESGRIEYEGRKDPENYSCLSKAPNYDLNMNPIFLDDYYPLKRFPRNVNPKYEFAGKVLSFESAKEEHLREIEKGLIRKYFWQGMTRGSQTFLSTINYFGDKITDKILSLNLMGKTEIIASTNSGPEYCYRTDINQYFAEKINKNISVNSTERFVYRIFAQEDKTRDPFIQLKTLGIKKGSRISDRISNIILFDDVYTSGSQTKALAYMLRDLAGFQGNIYCLTLGKTVK
jgi:hypothetical protein